MTANRRLERDVRSWLRENGREDAERVLFTVLDQLDSTPQRHAGWLARTFPFMNSTTLRFGVAAAAIVAVALFGIYLIPRGVGGPASSPTPLASPTPPVATPDAGAGVAIPTGLPVLAEGTQLEGGTYLLGEPFALTAAVTVPDGWYVTDLKREFVLLTADADIADQGIRPALGLWLVDFIPESCPVTGAEPTPQPSFGSTPADLAAAIAGRPGYAEIEMQPVTLDGHGGVEMELRPALGGLRCTEGHVRSYRAGPITRQQYPGDVSRITILAIEGQSVLVDRLYWSETSDDATSEAALAELETVYQSVNFAP